MHEMANDVPQEEVLKSLRDAESHFVQRNGALDVGGPQAVPKSDVPSNGAGQNSPAAIKAHRQPKPKPTLPVIDARTIYNADYPEPEFTIEDLLLRGVTILAGRPKIGKSFLGLQLALAVAYGSTAIGRFKIVRPGGVLYVALEESPRRTRHRIRKFIQKDAPHLENIQFCYNLRPLTAGGAEELDAALTKTPAEFVIIDTLLAVVRASGKRDVLRSDYEEVKKLMELAEKHQCAILVVHHLRKLPANGHALDAVAGTTGVTASADSIWTLTPVSDSTFRLVIQGRDLENCDYELTFSKNPEHFGWHVTAEGTECGLSPERRDILTVLQQEGAQKPAAIARLLGNRNVVTVRRLISEMVKKGTIRKQSNGTYVPENTLSHMS